MGYTRVAESSASLQEMLNLIGHNSIKVVGLSKRKFLLSTECEKGWENFNKNEFDKFFVKIRDFMEEDFVLERTV